VTALHETRQLALALATSSCQRWQDGRTRYRPPGELFDPRYFAVELIDEPVAKAFTERHHYSHAWPATRLRVGLLEKRPFLPERLCGVAAFSHPMSQAVLPKWLGVADPMHGVELGRFVLLDDIKAMGETWTLARAFRLLRRKLPDVQGVVAFCDPAERRAQDGTLTKRGHTGVIYRGFNARFGGRTEPRRLLLTPAGTVASERALSKIRNGEQGSAYALRQLSAAGCSRRHSYESGSAYVARLVREGELRSERTRGNLAFTWSLPSNSGRR